MALQRPTIIPTPHVVPRGAPGLVMGPCIVETDQIVIREVQYRLEVNRYRNEEIIVKGNFGWVWSMLAGRPRIDRFDIRTVHYQFEVNQCRNEEIIIKGNFRLIDRIVIREVQYQLKVNRLKGNLGWAWSMWAWRPRDGNGAMHNVQYQFEVNWCRNEEANFQGYSDEPTDGRRI
ncbi:hypothetical protein DPMN_066152 [Dreissena polymorpha]|uniref:Uncharacterized protein n=1 Tax=Dreissena polymorpha TaxID=45954 RepID=A0A9D3YSY6_DREPO|nr:hypothetical protein DPMN_066152 [Dreissena polymorpha]